MFYSSCFDCFYMYYLRYLTCSLLVSLFFYCVLVIAVCVFFFKQKTAYEMRISDWSSDVCSSDLSENAVVHFPFDPPEFGGHVVGAEQPAFDLFDVASVIPMDVIQVQQAAVLVGNESILREPHAVQRGILFDSGPFEQFLAQFSRGQLGSASCRERVFTYGEK